MRNLPYHQFGHNQIWLEIVALATDLLTWTQTLAWNADEPARRWEPKRLRLRVLAVAGRIIHTGRRRRLRLPRGWPWNHLIDTGWAQPGKRRNRRTYAGTPTRPHTARPDHTITANEPSPT